MIWYKVAAIIYSHMIFHRIWKAARIWYQSSLICGKRESFENQYDFILYDFVGIETYERWEKKKFIRGQILTWLLFSVGAYTLAQA